MNRVGRAALLVSMATIATRLLWTGGYGQFVQQRMFIPLLLATVVLAGLGVFEAVTGLREEQRLGKASRWPVAPAVGWLLVLPLVVLVAVDPTGLGAAAAGRVEAFAPARPGQGFPPLDPGDEPVEMRVYDFLNRALWDDERSLEGRTVRLEGLVVNDDRVPDGFMLTRFMVSCCAADGIPLQVAIRGVDRSLDDDTWVVADVIWSEPPIPYEEMDPPRIVEADPITITPQPEARNDPYESPY